VLTGVLVVVGEAIGVDVRVLMGVLVGTCVLVGVLTGVFVAVLVGTAVLVGVLVGVLVAVLTRVLVGVLVAVFVGVLVAVLTGVLVGTVVLVAVLVGVLVGTDVLVGVFVGVLTGPALMVSVPVPSAKSLPSAALTVNGYIPAGLLTEVVNVKVKDGNAVLPVDVQVEFGEKLAVTPAGKPETTLSVPFTVPLLPRPGVTAKVADALVPEVSVPVWPPTETEVILGPSVKIPVIKTPDVKPLAA
jgi:hypothetical protein